MALVSGTMPARNVEYTVVYYGGEGEDPTNPTEETLKKAVKITSIEDYETPLGLGEIIMHVGVCFE